MSNDTGALTMDQVADLPIGPLANPATVETPIDTPKPTGTRTRRPSAPKAKPKRGPGRPRKSTGAPGAGTAADMAAAAASEALTPGDKKPGRPSITATKNEALEAGLRNFYIGMGAMMNMAGQWFKNERLAAGGSAMMAQAGDCAAALVVWSNNAPAVRKALESITVAGGASVVIAAHAPIAMAVLGFAQPVPAPAADPGAVVEDEGPMAGFDLSKLAAMGAAFLAADSAPVT